MKLNLGGAAGQAESDVKLKLILKHQGDGFSLQLGASVGCEIAT